MNTRGVVAPILTPFNDDLSIAHDLYVAHAHWLINQGCVAIAPFGTTGEGPSVGIDERIAAIDALIDGGIDPAILIPGTGLSDLTDTARLSRSCLELGCAAVMTLPPFYFKAVNELGLYNYFSRLVAMLGSDARIFLYSIPPIAYVAISPPLAARLHAEYPRQIIGIKDSSGDWGNTRALLDIEGMIVYPGSELPLLDALALGAPGCISATANLNAGAIADVIERFFNGDIAGAKARHEQVSGFRKIIQANAPIAAQKRLLAAATGESRWANVRPPLLAMSIEDGQELSTKLKKHSQFELSLSS